MIGRKPSCAIFLTLLAALFSVLVLAHSAFAQNPTGRENPTLPKKEPTPAKKEKSKSVASSAGSAGSVSSGKSDRSGKSGTVRASAAKTTPGAAKLTIVAPPGASVEVDSKPRGTVGADGNLVLSGLAPGDHQVSVSAAGYEPWRDTFVMSVASTKFEVPINKKPSTGRLALTSSEPGTEILIDEKYGVKTLPGQIASIDGLLPGVRQLRAIKPGFREWRGVVAVKNKENVMGNIELKTNLSPENFPLPASPVTPGSPKSAKNQHPPHQVFTTAFEISRGEVNNRLYKFFIDATNHPAPRGVSYGWNGNNYPAGQDDLPVVFVSWEDAVVFCKWLSEQTGYRYRLPTESEWEKA